MSAKEKKSITTAGENYLKAVLMIQKQKGAVRSVDLAQHMAISKPSVSVAVHALEDAGFLFMDGEKLLHLTDTGLDIAEKMYERHCFFTKVLVLLGVDPVLAEKDACNMEHHVSDESFYAMKFYCESIDAI